MLDWHGSKGGKEMKYFSEIYGFLLDFDDLSDVPNFSVNFDCKKAKICRKTKLGNRLLNRKDEAVFSFEYKNPNGKCSLMALLFREDFSLVGISAYVNGIEIRGPKLFNSLTIKAKEGIEQTVRKEILSRATEGTDNPSIFI